MNNSTCEDDNTVYESAFIIVTTTCAPFTIIFNGIVLYIAFKFIDLRSKVNQFFVVSMTAADFVYGVNFMATRPLLDYFPYWLCRPYYVVIWMCQIASVMFLLFLNVDKFISLTVPLRYHVIVTERKVLVQTGVCWAIIFLYAVGSVVEPSLKLYPNNSSNCRVRLDAHNYAFMIFICYMCPIVISLVISIYIFVLAQHKTRFVPDFPDSQINRKERKRLFKRIFFVFSSTVWTAVTSLPFRMLLCYTFFEKPSSDDTAQPTMLESGFNYTTPSANFTPSYATAKLVTYDADNSSNGSIWENQSFDGSAGDDCQTQLTAILVWSFMYLLQLGSVGNPLITIITQRAYRQRALFLWSVFLKRVHGPKVCLPLSYMSVRRKSKSEDESTKVVDVMMSNENLTSAPPSSQKRSSKQHAFELM